MALVDLILAQPFGSQSGFTLAQTSGTGWMRQRSMPCSPATTTQVVARRILGGLAQAWRNVLSSTDRSAWATYAAATPIATRRNPSTIISGWAHFYRSNRPRIQQGLSIIVPGPSTAGLPALNPPILSVFAGASTLQVDFVATDDWVSVPGASLLLWLSTPQPANRETPVEIYSPLGRVDGSTTPPTSPAFFAYDVAGDADTNALWLRASLTMPDGTLSQN